MGTDENNFYLYRTQLVSGTWEPEIVIDLGRWITLRGELERRWLAGEPPSGAAQCGGDSTAFVACDGPYLVHVRDPGTTPPNLAQVSEVAVGIYRLAANVVVDPVEVWVDDIRLGDVVNRAGLAAALDARVAAGDVADFSLNLMRRDDRFRQLDEDPTYVTDFSARLGSTVRLDRLLPASWGLALPFTIQHARTSSDPYYLTRTDVLATALSDLRRPKSSLTTLQLDLRRTTRGGGWLPELLLDPLTVSALSEQGDARSELWSATTRNRRLRADYISLPGARSVGIVPGFLRDLVGALPGWIRDSDFGRALLGARLRLNPARVRLGSSLVDDDTRRSTFRVPVALDQDTLIRSVPSIVHRWSNQAGLELRPFETLSLQADLTSLRDLQNYADTTAMGRSLAGRRGTLLGRDVGFERQRSLTTGASVAPVVSSWLKPRFAWASGFTLVQDPNQRVPLLVGTDSIAPLAAANFRRRQYGAGVDLARLGRGGALGWVLRAFLPADLTWTRERRSAFDRLAEAPSLSYQLAFGSLDDFRGQGGTLATTALETETLTASGGARLGTGVTLRGGYRDTDGTTWVRQGEAQIPLAQHTREWPSATLSLNLRPGGAVVKSLSAQTQYRLSQTTIRQGLPDSGIAATAWVASDSRLRLFQPSLSVSWAGGVTTGAQYGWSRTDLTTAGNINRNDRVDWGANLGFSFRSPAPLARLPNPIRTTMSASGSDSRACLIVAGGAECVPVADSRRRQLDVRMDTGVSPTVVGGLSFSYILTDQRHLSSRFSQYVFTVFAEINFLSGRTQ